MEAPEKIYMTPSFGEPDNVLLASFSKSHLDYHRDIEYTRTDAFIEKACEWLQEHKNDYAFPIYQGEELTDESYVSDDIIKDLRKAMKGE